MEVSQLIKFGLEVQKMYFDDELFNPENIEHWLLLILYLALTIYGLWLAWKQPESNREKPSHRYNRKTGQVERNED